jgi:hypothetical protein
MIEEGRPTVAVSRRLVVAGDVSTDKRLFYWDGKLAANATGGRLIPICSPDVLLAIKGALGGRYDAI